MYGNSAATGMMRITISNSKQVRPETPSALKKVLTRSNRTPPKKSCEGAAFYAMMPIVVATGYPGGCAQAPIPAWSIPGFAALQILGVTLSSSAESVGATGFTEPVRVPAPLQMGLGQFGRNVNLPQ
jgi:hypothetical protein